MVDIPWSPILSRTRFSGLDSRGVVMNHRTDRRGRGPVSLARPQLNNAVERLLRRAVLLAALFAAAGLRWWGTSYGLPEITHPDEPLVVGPAMRIAAGGGWNPEMFFYPSLQIYGSVAAYNCVAWIAEILGWVDIVTDLGEPTFYRITRTLTVLCSVTTLYATYAVGRQLCDRWSAFVGLALVSVSLLHVSNSFLATTDVPMGCWALLASIAALKILEPSAQLSHYVIAAVLAGLATGTKYNGAFAVLPILVAHLLAGGRSLFDRRLVLAAVVSVATFLATTPYAVLDYPRFSMFMDALSKGYTESHPGADSDGLSYGFYARAILTKFGVVATAASIAGWGALLWGQPRRALVLVVYPIVLFLVMGAYPVRYDRNIVAVLPYLALGATALVARFASWRSVAVGQGARHGAHVLLRWLPVVLLVAGLSFQVGAQAKASYHHTRLATLPNTRLVANRWVSEHLPAGSYIGREHYTPAVDPGRFRVDELGYYGLMLTVDLDRYDYIIASSGDYGRFVNHAVRYPLEAAAYAAIFENWELVKTFRKDGVSLIGPEIRVYRRVH